MARLIGTMRKRITTNTRIPDTPVSQETWLESWPVDQAPDSQYIRELPKFVILALRDAVSRTFLAVRSRWTTDSRCRWSSPRATQTRMYWETERGMLGVDSRRSSRLESSLSMTRRGSHETQPNELGDVGVTDASHESTLSVVVPSYVGHSTTLVRLQ